MKKLSIGIMLMVLAFPIFAIGAEENGNQGNSAGVLNIKKAESKEKQEEKVKNKCENVQLRIENRIGKYEEKGDSVDNVHKKLKERVSNLATRLENNGVDASKLKSDLNTLNDKINKVASDYESFISALGETKNYACGESQGQFKSKLQESRKLLVTVRQDRQEVRDYITKTIIPDIKSLREQLKNRVQEQKGIQPEI